MTPIENSKTTVKKFKKLKIPLLPNFKAKQVGKDQERVKIKIIIPFRSYPNRNRKFQKSRQKIKKYPYSFISSQNWLEKTEKERK